MKKNRYVLLLLSILFLGIAIITNYTNATYTVSAVTLDSPTFNRTNKVLANTLEISERYEVKGDATLPDDPTNLGGIVSLSDNLLADMLINIYRNYDPRYTSSSLRLNMFNNFTKLDLSNIVNGTSNVIDVSGLKNLAFENLTTLNLSNNNIESFSVSNLPNNHKISSLVLENNNLTGELDLSTLEELTNLDVSNNKLTSIKFNVNQRDDCVLDYADNNISNFDDLTLPTNANVLLIILGNPMEVVDSIPSNIKMEVGVLNISDTIDTNRLIRYIAFAELNYDVKMYVKTKSEDDSEETVYTEYNYNPEGLSNFAFKLTAGYYRVDIVDKDGDAVLSSREFIVKPHVGKIWYKVKNNWYSEYTKKFSNKSYIYFNVVGTPSNNNVEFDETVTVKFTYNNSKNWQTGNKCDLTKRNGTYPIAYKYIQNDVESDTYMVLVSVTYSKFLPDIVIILLIVAFIVFLAAVMVPLLKKLLDKISK